MDELKKFIAEMREKNLSDELIYKNLLQKGWDEKLVNEAFLPDGTDVPTPSAPLENTTKTTTEPAEQTITKQSELEAKISESTRLSKAESVLHHVFLWIFSIAFVVNVQVIAGIINSSYDYDDTVTKTLASSVMTLLITGAIYGVFYWSFAKKFKQDSSLMFHGGWNLATIILGSLVGILALIALIAALIWETDLNEILPRLLPIIIYCVIAVLNYALINFGDVRSQFRKKYALMAYWLVLLVTIIATLLAVSYIYFDKKGDRETMEDVVETVQENYKYYKQNGKLASKLSDLDMDSAKISYRVLDSGGMGALNCIGDQADCKELLATDPTFEICGEFKYANDSGYYNSYTDDYIMVYDEFFNLYRIGKIEQGLNCFKFKVRK